MNKFKNPIQSIFQKYWIYFLNQHFEVDVKQFLKNLTVVTHDFFVLNGDFSLCELLVNLVSHSKFLFSFLFSLLSFHL